MTVSVDRRRRATVKDDEEEELETSDGLLDE
jgi:hypothetical protein